MYSYISTSMVPMAKQYRSVDFPSADQPGRFVKPKRLRARRHTPPSVLTSRWWVAGVGLRTGLGATK
jgi:hypothetical protein